MFYCIFSEEPFDINLTSGCTVVVWQVVGGAIINIIKGDILE